MTPVFDISLLNIAMALVFGGFLGGFLIYFLNINKISTLTRQSQEQLFHIQTFQERLQALDALKTEHHTLQQTHIEDQKRIRELETLLTQERKHFEESISLLQTAEQKLREAFQSLSSEALQKNTHHFLEIAKSTFDQIQQGAKEDLEARQKSISEFIKPVRESLDKMDQKIQEVEKNRAGAYEGLKSQIHHLLDAQKDLRSETVNLVHALKTPHVRGRWGEIQLRRVVEMAGMVSHCDFIEQVATQADSEAAERLRPDMVVNLPGGQTVVIDAKAPMRAYLEAIESSDATTQKNLFQHHARLIRQHVKQLSAKSYWSQFDHTPEFVVLFLPGEQFFSAALQEDPGLIELGADNKVILATPTTLIALLRAVAYGWRQERLAENAREISTLGQQLYDRLADMSQHLSKLGRHLGQTVQSYNQTIGSFEQRVMVSARRFESLGIEAKKSTDPVTPLEAKERDLIS